MGVYKGICAHCGCSRESKWFVKYKRGGYTFQADRFVLRDDAGQTLPYASDFNNRVCRTCYEANRQAMEARRTSPRVARSKIVTFKTPRSSKKRLAPAQLFLPERSSSVRQRAEEIVAQLPAKVYVDTRKFIAALLSSPCGAPMGERCCGGALDLYDADARRDAPLLELYCHDCQRKKVIDLRMDRGDRIELSPEDKPVFSFSRDDVRTVLLTLLSGATYTQYSIMNASSQGILSSSSFYMIQSALVRRILDAGHAYFSGVREAFAAELRKRNAGWSAQANGAWSHRGWKARMHTYQLRDNETGILLCSVVLQKSHYYYHKAHRGGPTTTTTVFEGNYVGTSAGMESVAFQQALEQLRQADLLASLQMICTDGDTSVGPTLTQSPDTRHIKWAGDPGHSKKNFTNALKEICGMGNYKGYAYRIPTFWMRCVKRAEAAAEGQSEDAVKLRKAAFDKFWAHALPHYCRRECPSTCPCNEFYLDAYESRAEREEDPDVEAASALLDFMDQYLASDKDEGEVEFVVPEALFQDEDAPRGAKRRYAAKKFLDEGDLADVVIINKLKVLMETAANNAEQVLYALNTCASEGANNRRLTFCRKDRFYYGSYEARSMLNALLDNLSHAEAYSLLSSELGLDADAHDAVAVAHLATFAAKKEQHSKRKKSVAFKEHVVAVRKHKIGLNVQAQAASDVRNKENKVKRALYKGPDSEANLSWKPMFRKKRGGNKSQQELAELKKLGMAHQCDICQKFYKRSHTCKGAPTQKRKRKEKRKEPAAEPLPEAPKKRNKSTRGPPTAVARWIEQHNQSAPQPLEWRPIVGDGNCLPRSLVEGFGGDWRTMREMAFSWAEHSGKRQEYQEFMGKQEGDEVYGAIGRYYADVGQEFIVIATHVLGRDVVIVEEKGYGVRVRRQTEQYPRDEPIYIHYNGRNHYNAIVPAQD
jgi:hypothetical protein